MNVYIDVETIPDQRPGARERFLTGLEPPGNMTKPETIAKWREEKAPAIAGERWLRTALDPCRGGELAVICYAVADGLVVTLARDLEGDEAALLRTFWDSLTRDLDAAPTDGEYRMPVFAGHNLRFDLRFLWFRSVVHGIRPPYHVPHDERAWTGSYIDTMVMATGSDSKSDGLLSLPDLCHALGIDISGDISGAEVWAAIASGNVAAVAEHCRADVERVRAVHRRLTFQPEPTSEESTE